MDMLIERANKRARTRGERELFVSLSFLFTPPPSFLCVHERTRGGVGKG